MVRAVGVVGRNVDGAAIANLHARHTAIETDNHLPAADLKLDGRRINGRVENRAVIEPAGVMNFYFIARFRFLHGHSFLKKPFILAWAIALDG
jgi:hypothetical protein